MNGCNYLDPEAVTQEWAHFALRQGDILLSTSASLGRVAVVGEDAVGAIPYTGIIRMRPRDKRLFAPYIRYLLEGPDFQRQAEMVGVGSVIRHFGPMHLRQISVRLPPVAEQRAIAHTLGVLDDKIELNRRMNETLEQIAQAIFKSWFVDFLPVRAKMAARKEEEVSPLPEAEPGRWFVYAIECEDESIYIGQTEDLRQRWEDHRQGRASQWTKGRRPLRVVHWESVGSREEAVQREGWLKTGSGRKWLKRTIARTQTGDPVKAKAAGRQPIGMDAATAALFPDSFEDSPLGEIPRGWRAGVLGEVAENTRRAITPADVPSGTPYIGLEHMPRKSIALAEWGQVDGVTSGKFQFRCGELLFGKLRPYFHKVGVAPVDGVCSTDILVITPKSAEWFGVVLGHVSSEALVEHANATSTGTKMPRTNWKDLAAFGVAIPPQRVAAAYTSMVSPVVDLIISNIHQSHTLVAIRDALLPKLMSGEIRVGQ